MRIYDISKNQQNYKAIINQTSDCQHNYIKIKTENYYNYYFYNINNLRDNENISSLFLLVLFSQLLKQSQEQLLNIEYIFQY